MKKIFSAALALVCVWFATPAFANCNLFDPSAVPSAYFATQGDGTVSNTITDTRTSFRIQTNITANGTNRALFYGDLETPGNYVKTFTIPEGTTSIIIKHNGTTKDIFLWSPNASVLAPGTYTLSFDILSSNPSVVGGLQLKNIQIERGSTATAYTPYNPLCATCDGTVVNYTSATGTGVQNGTPTPDNPIEPTFYKQGNMVLRAVGDVADSYDATTGKITRRVGVKVFDGTEGFSLSSINDYGIANYQNTMAGMNPSGGTMISSHFGATGSLIAEARRPGLLKSSGDTYFIRISSETASTVAQFKSWLAAQKAAGTPVTIYYPLETETTEDWTETSYCEIPIKIATTKYNETAFGPLNTALANAISVVDTVVSNTITQAASIATLQAQKQTRPNDIADDSEKCPAGKKCLLVEDASGVPHWYEIVEQYSLLPDGYTELEYIQTDGNSWINTGYIPNGKPTIKTKLYATALGTQFWGCRWTPAPTYDTLGAIVGSGGNLTIYYGLYGNEEFTAFSDYRTGVVHTFELGESSIIYDGLTTNISRENISSTYSFVVGGFNNNGEINQTGISRIYSMEVKESGNMMLNLIPAKNASGVVGMYDTVSGTFFTNAGTGEFIAGEPVSE